MPFRLQGQRRQKARAGAGASPATRAEVCAPCRDLGAAVDARRSTTDPDALRWAKAAAAVQREADAKAQAEADAARPAEKAEADAARKAERADVEAAQQLPRTRGHTRSPSDHHAPSPSGPDHDNVDTSGWSDVSDVGEDWAAVDGGSR